MLHLATVIAVCIALSKSIFNLVKWPVPKKAWRLLIATIPGIIVGVLISVLDLFENLEVWVLGIFFLVTAALLFVTELAAKRREKTAEAVIASAAPGVDTEAAKAAVTKSGAGTADADVSGKAGIAFREETGNEKTEAAGEDGENEITLKQAIIMGCAQAVAVLPGISRSGSTVCAGVLQGADRKKVADFSFLMSVIIILGSAVWEFADVIRNGIGDINWFYLALGMSAAFLSGLFAINLMLKLIVKGNLKWFSLYLVGISILSIVLSAMNIV
jgi:undecaprenyl pyrophosphate phosphatase UppP